MDIVLSKKDTEWVSTQYPGLKVDISKKEIIGDIFVERLYNDRLLSGVFSIRIELFIRDNTALPKVYEVGRKLETIATKLDIENFDDIHVNPDKSLCLVIRDKEEECFSDRFSIREFLLNCVEPYFYWVMHYEKYGEKPWGEYAHKELGFFELYSEGVLDYSRLMQKFDLFTIQEYLQTETNGECLCGSAIKMELCHNEIYQGLVMMKAERSLREFRSQHKGAIALSRPISLPRLFHVIA